MTPRKKNMNPRKMCTNVNRKQEKKETTLFKLHSIAMYAERAHNMRDK